MSTGSDTRTYVINRSRPEPPKSGPRPTVTPEERRRREIESGEVESFSEERVTRAFATALAQARVAKNWKQKDLATQSQVPLSVVTDYEAARGKPNQQYRKKLERALGVTLPK